MSETDETIFDKRLESMRSEMNKAKEYFLYFIEHLVITSLQDFIVNNWSKDELMKDFSYKKHWVIHGIKNK